MSCVLGVCVWRGWCVWGACVAYLPWTPPPPPPRTDHLPVVNRMTERCKNITFPHTTYAVGNNRRQTEVSVIHVRKSITNIFILFLDIVAIKNFRFRAVTQAYFCVYRNTGTSLKPSFNVRDFYVSVTN